MRDLCKYVTAHLSKGWHPYGEAFQHGHLFYQVVVQYEEAPETPTQPANARRWLDMQSTGESQGDA